MRATTLEEREVMEYLNDLRDSGITNMFGATPYIVRHCEIPEKEARRILGLWMNNFKEGNYETVKE
jgi:hypothetical protein